MPSDRARCYPRTHDDRRAREAPLVALVDACPEGLDPIGWRAAVLAAAEKFMHPDRYRGIPAEGWRQRLACCLLHEVGAPTSLAWQPSWNGPYVSGARLDAIDAYRRAVAAQGPRPMPERKIGGRAVRLVVDHGEG